MECSYLFLRLLFSFLFLFLLFTLQLGISFFFLYQQLPDDYSTLQEKKRQASLKREGNVRQERAKAISKKRGAL